MATPSSSSSALFMTKFKGSEEEEVEDDEEEDVEDEESLNHIKIIINYFLYIKYIMIILNELYMMLQGQKKVLN